MTDGTMETVRMLDNGEEYYGLWTPVSGATTESLREILFPNPRASDRVIFEARRILSQCSPPTSRTSSRTGLICGYVQSGKTASMIAVSALAKDNGFRILILLAGVTTNLVDQNRERLESTLRQSSSEWSWIMLSNPTAARDSESLSALANEWSSPHYDEADRRTLLITVMKHHQHLANLSELLRSVDLTGVPAIIFDDEADQASLNTRPTRPEPSATYREIAALRSTLPHHTYLQYTATPQAPLLITRIDSLSADFAELVSPGEGYIGGRDFFSAPMDHVEAIPPQDVFPDGTLPLEPPESLLRALAVFFVGVAAGRCGEVRKHRSMLIHPSKATNTHQRYYEWTNAVKSAWHATLVDGSSEDRKDLLEEFREAYEDLESTASDIPSFSSIVEKLPVAINQTTVTIVNSRDGHEVPWQNGYSHILVGGEKLGRGYTVKGLTVTYMPRSPGGWTADTIQQRARFFGYHDTYFGFCRVYLHPDVRAAYVAYVDHEEDMRKRLAENSGQPLKDWRRVFYLDRRLAPTRRNVLTSPYLRPRLPNGWFSPRAPHESIASGARNRALLSQFDTVEFAPHDRFPQHQWAVLRLDEVFERFLVPLSYLDDDDAVGLCVVNCNLKTMIDENGAKHCVVYLMDQGRFRRRSLVKGQVPQLFQGRSSAGSDFYPGDRAFCDPRLPTIQLHRLTLTENDAVVHEDVLAVAIKVPNPRDVLVHTE